MIDLEFENLGWIHALWGVLLLAFLFIFLELRKQAGSASFVTDKMQKRLARTSTLMSRLTALVFLTLAMCCLVLALMRPQYGFVEKTVPHVGAQVMVCLDVSKSMLAEDAAPNRLERAKSELEVLLNYLQEDQVGLIAFAGKAAVLCPMTTDYGYLKMVLRETSPTSIGRGGTLLEGPIRRAMAGFSDDSNMSKVVVLITDGEDNGSKPLDAAKEAAERGIRIITIGFGHERGSKIEITDSRTGLSTYVKDSAGRDVISRLDLDLLTKIASVTKGACIPARVGSLDVETIHQDHIRPLTRSASETKLVIKNEAFQWPLLAGILFTFLALVISNPLAFSKNRFGDWLLSQSTVRLIPLLLLCCPDVTFAQASVATQGSASPSVNQNQSMAEDKKDAKGLGSDFSSRTLEDLIPDDPLESYNLSVDVLQSNPEYAEKLLEASRRDAGDNALLRFHSSYNLGWAKVYQANENLEQQPEEALRHLNAAADWFRESIRLRPKNDQARQNLEIVLRRITELNDSLNQKDKLSFEQQLDQLIERQSQLVQSYRQLLQRSNSVTSGLMTDELKKSFRLGSVDQRILNSDLQEVARKASQTVEDFRRQGKPTGQPTSDNATNQKEQLRVAQIEMALAYVDRAAQRLGQARSQLRLYNVRRAALRGTLGIDELKRARDQLRNPADILRQIIADSELLQQHTKALVAGKNSLAAFLGNQTTLPKWLDQEYLVQFQTTQLERTNELSNVLEALAKNQQASQAKPDSAGTQSETQLVARAATYVSAAADSFRTALDELSASRPRGAPANQTEAVKSLREAYELFADLKGLLELTYFSQVDLNGKFPAASNLSGTVLQQVANSLVVEVKRNSDRLARIRGLIDQELAAAQNNQNSTSGSQQKVPGQNAGQGEDQESKKLQYAKQLAERIASENQELSVLLTAIEMNSATNIHWPDLDAKGKNLEQGLMELRRIFFSIVEHLRETADRQQQLNADTNRELTNWESKQAQPKTKVDGKSESVESPDDQGGESRPNAGKAQGLASDFSNVKPLSSRQAELASITDQIGNGLQQMADSMGQQIQPGSPDSKQSQQIMNNYTDASKLVLEGKSRMDNAVANIEAAELDPNSLRSEQRIATEKLLEAIRLLQPPDQNQNDDQQNQPNQGQGEPQKSAGSNQALLQRIRDLEAKRRQSKNKKPFAERVEKDW